MSELSPVAHALEDLRQRVLAGTENDVLVLSDAVLEGEPDQEAQDVARAFWAGIPE